MREAMNLPGPLVRVIAAEPLEDFRMRLTFEDGTEKVVDPEPYLRGPVFEPIRQNREGFRAVKIEGGTIVWANGADIDPDVLYYGLTPAWMEKEESKKA
jgi:hypothetical protein